ncbi:Mth938-like domain-containing protein [Archaeoglobus veneficus]|uniref:Uncharacterized protein n=1 Tax=Archaeoglobus veneficus (strain DSM 11195 / SNP6) TaxID=693661 RepID=F2KMV6_ARCVS|nr:MTH938/NDUFAF3 family protein [Archaeoglobus veneficus]AEA46130.1 protein of unknown function DUF498 [Archaeoglobus veneficus SNP6]
MLIEDYGFGRIVVKGRTYTSDVIVFWDGSVKEWWRKKGHYADINDVKSVLDAKPEVIVFGTGKYGAMKVDENAVKELEKMGIHVEVDITERATKIFNDLVAAGKRAVLAAHLTC